MGISNRYKLYNIFCILGNKTLRLNTIRNVFYFFRSKNHVKLLYRIAFFMRNHNLAIFPSVSLSKYVKIVGSNYREGGEIARDSNMLIIFLCEALL